MKKLYVALAVAAFALSGCVTLSRTDRYLLMDHQVPAPLCAHMAHGEPLALDDIIELSHRKLSPPFIMHYLYRTEAVYRLGSSDIKRLKAASVAPEVIDYLQRTPMLFGVYGGGAYYGPHWYGSPNYYGEGEPYWYGDPYYYPAPYYGVEVWGGRYRGPFGYRDWHRGEGGRYDGRYDARPGRGLGRPNGEHREGTPAHGGRPEGGPRGGSQRSEGGNPRDSRTDHGGPGAGPRQ